MKFQNETSLQIETLSYIIQISYFLQVVIMERSAVRVAKVFSKDLFASNWDTSAGVTRIAKSRNTIVTDASIVDSKNVQQWECDLIVSIYIITLNILFIFLSLYKLCLLFACFTMNFPIQQFVSIRYLRRLRGSLSEHFFVY